MNIIPSLGTFTFFPLHALKIAPGAFACLFHQPFRFQPFHLFFVGALRQIINIE